MSVFLILGHAGAFQQREVRLMGHYWKLEDVRNCGGIGMSQREVLCSMCPCLVGLDVYSLSDFPTLSGAQ